MLVAMRSITEPVRRLNAATKRVAQGDFEVEVPEVARDELGQLTHNFNRMTRQLKQMETLRSDFISSISHEFKTPLASIQGFARLLQNRNLPPERMEEYTRVILEETTRLTTLSSNILRLNALENQSIPHKSTEFSLDEQIRRCVLVLASAWEPRQIEFDMNLEPVQYFGDQDLLQQVWHNLIGNAIKFSYQGGKIALGLTRKRSGIFFTCQDWGAGIAPEDAQRVFEKFYQADRSRAREGNGLGLSIVQRILSLCGGSINFESQPGKGSTFTVQLPHPQREASGTPPKRTGRGEEKPTVEEKRRNGDNEKGETAP
jgi:signal transduction histidine kinase